MSQSPPKFRRLCLEHDGTCGDIAVSPDGTLFAASFTDGFIFIWSPLTESNHNFKRHDGHATSIQFSPDSSTIISGGADAKIKQWASRGEGETVKELEGHTRKIWALRFSPDGKIFGSVSGDKTARLWNFGTGACTAVLEGHTQPVTALEFGPKGMAGPAIVATCSWDHTVRLWDLATKEIAHVLTGHTGNVCMCSFSTKGDLLATASSDATVKMWDPVTGSCFDTLQEHTSDLALVAFSPSASQLVTVGVDGNVWGMNVRSGKSNPAIPAHAKSINDGCYSVDGSVFATASDDGTVAVWDAAGENGLISTELICRLSSMEMHPVVKCKFSPDGTKLVAVSISRSRSHTLLPVLSKGTKPPQGKKAQVIIWDLAPTPEALGNGNNGKKGCMIS